MHLHAFLCHSVGRQLAPEVLVSAVLDQVSYSQNWCVWGLYHRCSFDFSLSRIPIKKWGLCSRFEGVSAGCNVKPYTVFWKKIYMFSVHFLPKVTWHLSNLWRRSFTQNRSPGIWASQGAHLCVVYHFFHLEDCFYSKEYFSGFSKNSEKEIPCNIDPITTDHTCLGMIIQPYRRMPYPKVSPLVIVTNRETPFCCLTYQMIIYFLFHGHKDWGSLFVSVSFIT